LLAALKAREDDEDNDDKSKAVGPWTLLQARSGSEEMKIYVLANQQEHPELRKYISVLQ
jgi:hypothetical protein